jgi:hypothetical protein
MKFRLIYVIILFISFHHTQIIAQVSENNTRTDFNKVSVGDGLTGHYYQGYAIDTTGYISFYNKTEVLTRIDTVIDFWNGNQYYGWDPVGGGIYGVEWNGYIYIGKSGQYGFGTISDDGSQIFIDSNLVVDNSEEQWFDWEDNISEGGPSDTSFPPLILDSGFHEICIRFYEARNYDGIEVWWLKADFDSSDIPYYGTNFGGIPPTYNENTNWEIIPKEVLYTVPDTLASSDYSQNQNHLPKSIHLFQNYPNPFNPSTTIEFTLPKYEFVTLKVYNILGEEIITLVNDQLQAGNYTFPFNGSDLASGIYLYRIEVGEFQDVKKMVLIK